MTNNAKHPEIILLPQSSEEIFGQMNYKGKVWDGKAWVSLTDFVDQVEQSLKKEKPCSK